MSSSLGKTRAYTIITTIVPIVAKTEQNGLLFSYPSYHIQFHSHYRGCYNLDENSGLFGATKSGTPVSAADVNDHMELGDASHYQPST